MRYLDIQDHMCAARVCREWLAYGSNEASWCRDIFILLRPQYAFVDVESKDHVTATNLNGVIIKRRTQYQIPRFTMGMFSRFTQNITITSRVRSEPPDDLTMVQTLWNNICDECTQLKYIRMTGGTLNLSYDMFKQLCKIPTLTNFDFDNVANAEFGAHHINSMNMSCIKSLQHLQDLPKCIMPYVLITENVENCAHIPITAIELQFKSIFTPYMIPSDLPKLKSAYKSLTVLELKSYNMTNDGFVYIKPFQNLTKLILGSCDLSSEFIQDICTSGLKLTTLWVNGCTISPTRNFHDGKGDGEYKMREFNQNKNLSSNTFKYLGMLTDLTELVFSFIGFTIEDQFLDDGSIAKPLSLLKNLTVIVLNSTQVGDETCKTIASLPNVDKVGISQTNVSDIGLLRLAPMPKLSWLSASGDNLTQPSRLNFINARNDNGLRKLDTLLMF